MVGLGAATGSGELPVGMWLYAFMFDEKHLLPELVAAGRLPAPASLLVGLAMGAALTAVRFALDFVAFKVRRGGVSAMPHRLWVRGDVNANQSVSYHTPAAWCGRIQQPFMLL